MVSPKFLISHLTILWSTGLIFASQIYTISIIPQKTETDNSKKQKKNATKSRSRLAILSYHDRDNLEADRVLHHEDGRYALIEYKLGSEKIEEGASNLLNFNELVGEFSKKNKQV